MYDQKNQNLAQASERKDAIQISSLAREIIEQFGESCTCSPSDSCDLCDFIQCLENSRGIVNYECFPTTLQSSAQDISAPDEGTNTTQEENVGFADDQEETVVDIPHDMGVFKPDSSQNVKLGSFLGRPVKIYAVDWQIGTSLTPAAHTFDPWYLFFNHTSIKKKLDNYYLVRCNLHLKFVINASPFYYGACLAAYQPLSSHFPGPIITTGFVRDLIPLSQRPHVYLYPQDSQGGEMVLPFIYHKNWLDATSSSDLMAMGTVDFDSINTLRNANGLTTESIEIQVYAWASDIELAGPTVALAVQSKRQSKKPRVPMKDEYEDDGVVSKTASALAKATGMLGSMPVIGPFATATSYAADAVSNIASLFGFTNTPVIDDVHQFQPSPFPNISSTDIGMPIDKLTLDAKNELSIDPRIAGVGADDEMAITHFVQRESFVAQAQWSATAVTDDFIIGSAVTPMIVDQQSYTNYDVWQYTPLAYLSEMFSFWRGDIIFRFKFLCSKYHRGRVRISWDPHGDIKSSGDYTTETYTQIVDIAEETDIEFRVPFTQQTSYLEVTDRGIYHGSNTPTAPDSTMNGTITCVVINKQTSPVASADITVAMFVRGAENFEFAGPKNIDPNLSPYVVQSKPFDKASNEVMLGCGPSDSDPNTNLVYMGETISNLRQLCRRQTLYRKCVPASASAIDTIYHTSHVLARLPIYPGYDDQGIDDALGITSGVAEKFNWVNWSPMSFLSLCYVGSRGSVVYTVNVCGQHECSSVTVSRQRSSHTNSTRSNTTSYGGSAALRAQPYITSGNYFAGGTITNQATQAGITALIPMYSPFKFLFNDYTTRSRGDSADLSNKDSVRIDHWYQTETNSYNDVYTDLYVGAGTDFSLIFFLNCPTLCTYDSTPTPL